MLGLCELSKVKFAVAVQQHDEHGDQRESRSFAHNAAGGLAPERILFYSATKRSQVEQVEQVEPRLAGWLVIFGSESVRLAGPTVL